MAQKYIKRSFTFEGKRYFVRGKTEKEAQRKLIQKQTELENHVRKITAPKTVSQWLDGWVETYHGRNVLKTRKHYQRILERFCEWIGDERMDRITQRDVQGYINTLEGMSVVSIQKVHDALHSFFETALYSDVVLRNPVNSIVFPRTSRPDKVRRRITDGERALILKVAAYHPFGLYLKIMLYCGLRTMEVAALDGRHIDLNAGVVHVRQTVKSDGTIGEPKSRSGYRDVPIPDALLPDLESLDLEPYAPALKYHSAHGVVRYNHNSVAASWKSYKECMATEGVYGSDLVMYDLRHTYCTDLQDAGVPINIARQLMGHSNIAITAGIYTHHSEESLEGARDLINRHQSPGQKRGTRLKIVDN